MFEPIGQFGLVGGVDREAALVFVEQGLDPASGVLDDGLAGRQRLVELVGEDVSKMG